jgi:hypothetical protein
VGWIIDNSGGDKGITFFLPPHCNSNTGDKKQISNPIQWTIGHLENLKRYLIEIHGCFPDTFGCLFMRDMDEMQVIYSLYWYIMYKKRSSKQEISLTQLSHEPGKQ